MAHMYVTLVHRNSYYYTHAVSLIHSYKYARHPVPKGLNFLVYFTCNILPATDNLRSLGKTLVVLKCNLCSFLTLKLAWTERGMGALYISILGL